MEEKLIKLVQDNSFLYDKRKEDYRNLDIKEKKWVEIAQQLNLPVNRVKQRWATLRDRYQKIKKNRKKDSKKGASSRYWKYFNMLCFLDDVPTMRPRISSHYVIYNTDEISAIAEEFISSYLDDNDKTEESYSSFLETSDGGNNNEQNNEISNINISSSESKYIEEDVTEIRSKPLFQPGNSTSLFFASICKQIQEAKLPKSSIGKIQKAVLEVVQKEIFKYDNSNSQ